MYPIIINTLSMQKWYTKKNYIIITIVAELWINCKTQTINFKLGPLKKIIDIYETVIFSKILSPPLIPKKVENKLLVNSF